MKLLPQVSRNTALSVFMTVIVSVALMVTSALAAKGGPALVLFNANWSASCREVAPIVKEIASQNNLAYAEIDVDRQDAPQQAKDYGLTIPSNEPPQVFYVNKGKAVLIFDGSNYRYGNKDAARSSILQKLQAVQ